MLKSCPRFPWLDDVASIAGGAAAVYTGSRSRDAAVRNASFLAGGASIGWGANECW